MHIVQENAEGFLRAFHAGQDEMIVAFLILTVRRKELNLFSALVEGVAELDLALGKEVGLFLFHPESLGGLEMGRHGERVIAGERLDARQSIGPKTRANRFYRANSPEQKDQWHAEYVRELIAQSSANIVPDFCQALEVNMSDLPCVCTVIRGVPGSIVTKAGDRLSFEAIVRAAENLRPHAEQARWRWSKLRSDVDNLKGGIALLESAEVHGSRLRTEMAELAAGLERRYDIIMAPQLVAMLASDTLSADVFDALIDEVSGASSEAVRSNSRSQGIRTRIKRLSRLRSDVVAFCSEQDAAKVAGYREAVLAIEDDLRRAVETAFADAGISVWRYRDKLGLFKKTSQLVATIGKATDLLRRPLAPLP